MLVVHQSATLSLVGIATPLAIPTNARLAAETNSSGVQKLAMMVIWQMATAVLHLARSKMAGSVPLTLITTQLATQSAATIISTALRNATMAT